MTLKKFKILKLTIVVILAMSVGVSVFYGNLIIPVVAMAAAISLMFFFGGK